MDGAEKANAAVIGSKALVNTLQFDKHCIDGPGKSGECKKIPLTIPIATQLLKNWYTDACYETEDAFYDIRCIWGSDDEASRKLTATNRLFIYYLLILAMYIIQICFIVDEKLFEGLCQIIDSIRK